nr:MAG TPA: polygalacturonase [Caudoviricetes sp.]
MLTVLRTTGASDIVLRDLVIEGGCNAGVTSKRAIRGVRFINCTDIRMINCEVSRTGDWATSFEKCTDVSVVNYRHRKSGGTLYGGRDGIHFLDCVNFTLNGADIESGDDMVGCTTETRDQRNAVIRNVIGYSMLASGVIFNEEGATTFSTVDILVDGVTIKSGNVVRDVVRVQGINDATNVTGVTVKNVKGTGYSHGVFISGKKLTRVSVSDIDVVSTQSHGVYINGAQNMRASGMGVSQAAAWIGPYISIHFLSLNP